MNSPMTPDQEAWPLRLSTGLGTWSLLILWSLLVGHGSLLAAVEPWADERLAVTNGLELWLDLSRQNAARGGLQLPPLASWNNVDYLLDGSGRGRHLAQPA